MLAGLKGLHDGMARGVEMLGGMLVFGTIAAADVAALKTQTQMDPGIAHLETFLAARTARLNFANLVKVRTLVRHRQLLLFELRLAQFIAASRW